MISIFNSATTASWITEPKTDTQYAIEETEDTLTIKFQWTVSLKDWIFNFLFLPFFMVKPYHHMPKLFFVHYGFLRKYKAVRKEIQQAVLNNLDKKIRILAYSQGADIGMLTHEDIVFTFGVRPETVLFGCSRVFSVFGRKMLSERLSGVTRIENGNDAVTKVPFFWMLYMHYGQKVHIGEKRHWYKFSFKDHLPRSYRASMEEV